MLLDRKRLTMQIRKLRARRKLSQEALADKAGIHRVSLANIERGAKTPTLDTLARLAKALRVPLHRLLALGGEEPMAVKVRERNGAWWLFVDFKGHRKARRVGVGREGHRAALRAVEQIQHRLALGDLSPLEDRKPPPATLAPPLFRDYAKQWLALRAHRWKPSSREQYDSHLRARLLPVFGPLPLSEITRPRVEAFVAEHLERGNRRRKGQGLAPITMRMCLSVLASILKKAVRDKWLSENPAVDLGDLFPTRGREGQRHIEVFTREEIATLLEAAERDWPEWAPFLLLLARTGMRLGEALAIQWGDVDLEGRLVWVRRSWRRGQVTTTKTGRIRAVDLSRQVCEALRGWQTLQAAEAALRGQTPPVWVFPDTSCTRPARQDTFRESVWEPLCRRAGLRYRPPHTLRHSYASELLQRGVPVTYISEQLGHSRPSFTMAVYSHVVPRANAGVVDLLDAPMTSTFRNPDATESSRPGSASRTLTHLDPLMVNIEP